ncbi:MAG: cytochrome c biogenesis protein ResB [Candidatus Eisenbacteria bacterium]|nr:cytochrome c biogenesis protein ResB [Candidatus Eisenbacteria bacterium]
MTSGSENARKRDSQGSIFAQLYALLTDTRFAIILLIVLAVVSILGILIIDRLPFRGEMARQAYAGRENDPFVWMLIHLVPTSPFRSFFFRTLLALLSLSLLACTIKRWRVHWRRAWSLPAASPELFASPAALRWKTRAADPAPQARRLLAARLFRVREGVDDPAGSITFAAARFSFAEMGSVLAHVGLLLLVIGGIVMASTGSSQMVWMQPGDEAPLGASGAVLRLEEFRIETTPTGRIADYVSRVSLHRPDARPSQTPATETRTTDIEVNHPLRHAGVSVYQAAYRRNPTRVRGLELLFDWNAIEELGFIARHGGTSQAAGHQQLTAQMANPMTVVVPWDSMLALPDSPFKVAIDTFLADFRIDEGGAGLASDEFNNPAARILTFVGDSLAGRAWYFAMHPDMPVGTGLVLPLRITDIDPEWMTGLEISTHPGSGFIWAGISIMTLGTLLAFLFRREHAWLRVSPVSGSTAGDASSGRVDKGGDRGADSDSGGVGPLWEVAFVQRGASRQAPEFARASWETRTTSLGVRLVRLLEPEGGQPVGAQQAEDS